MYTQKHFSVVSHFRAPKRTYFFRKNVLNFRFKSRQPEVSAKVPSCVCVSVLCDSRACRVTIRLTYSPRKYKHAPAFSVCRIICRCSSMILTKRLNTTREPSLFSKGVPMPADVRHKLQSVFGRWWTNDATSCFHTVLRHAFWKNQATQRKLSIL